MAQKTRRSTNQTPFRRGQLVLLIIALPLSCLGIAYFANPTARMLMSSDLEYTADTSPADFNDLSNLSRKNLTRLDHWLAKQVERGAYPSVSMAIATSNGVVHAAAFGWADRAQRRRATEATLYQQASVTKIFTATLATILHHKGVVDLDRPIVDILPDGVALTQQPTGAAAITLRHLATYASGLQRGVDHPVQLTNQAYADFDPRLFYECLSRSQLIFPPGTNRQYSNLGYGLLAHCLELQTGRTFNVLLNDHLLHPVGLKSTFVLDQRNAGQQSRLAVRYDESGRDRGPLDVRKRLVGSGGLVATPSDVARLGAFCLRAHAGKEAIVPADARIARADSFRTAVDGPIVAFGWDAGGTRVFGKGSVEFPRKNGGRSGVSAYLLLSPAKENSFAVALSINLDVDSNEGTTAGDIARAIMRSLLATNNS